MSKVKYYETHFTEYLRAVNLHNLHPELDGVWEALPPRLDQLGNLILYGPPGSGKYTQFLRIVDKYWAAGAWGEGSSEQTFPLVTYLHPSASSTALSTKTPALDPSSTGHRCKMDKMTSRTDKHEYTYRISDLHYEIDLAQLGCEAKKMWNECFFQIVDVITTKPAKTGIILCRNFHSIYGELVEPFYSYMQHSRTLGVHIVFVFLTDHLSFIPTNIVQCCKTIAVRRPARESYEYLVRASQGSPSSADSNNGNGTDPPKHCKFLQRISTCQQPPPPVHSNGNDTLASTSAMDELPLNALGNLKECHLVAMAASVAELPKDVFNIVCDNIIREMLKTETLNIIELRDHLYDILLYGLDITECLWYILFFFVENGYLDTTPETMATIMERIFVFLKHYNNNYRPIYHLESIVIFLVTQLSHALPANQP
jgi:hypothetical protein